jgi:hypothetical protein
MGAVAVWNIAMRYGDLFGGYVAINGAPSVWERFGPDFEKDFLFRNLESVSLLAIHGLRDEQISPELDREGVRLLRTFSNVAPEFVEVEGGAHSLSGMFMSPETVHYRRMVEFVDAVGREKIPTHVVHRATRGHHGRCYWIRVDDLVEGRAVVEADVVNRGRIVVKSAGARALDVGLHADLLDGGPVLVQVDGEEFRVSFLPRDGRFPRCLPTGDPWTSPDVWCGFRKNQFGRWVRVT